jgi:hypothetical protein
MQGTGKFMRHELSSGAVANAAGMRNLIDAANSDMKARVDPANSP